MAPGPASGGWALRAEGLGKHFYSGLSFSHLLMGRLRGRRIQALRGVDLNLERGEVLGIMGENGAGKSTLLRLAAGLLLPDEGRLEVLGCDARRAGPALRRRVGYVGGAERSFSYRLTGAQNMNFFAALYGMSGRDAGASVARILEVVGLDPGAVDRPVREYSSGMRQRLALARGLLGEPDLLLLDEPTRGVDPAGAAALRAHLTEQALVHGRAAVLATHDPAEARQLCQRALLLRRGEVAAQGAVGAVLERLARHGAQAGGDGRAPVPV